MATAAPGVINRLRHGHLVEADDAFDALDWHQRRLRGATGDQQSLAADGDARRSGSMTRLVERILLDQRIADVAIAGKDIEGTGEIERAVAQFFMLGDAGIGLGDDNARASIGARLSLRESPRFRHVHLAERPQHVIVDLTRPHSLVLEAAEPVDDRAFNDRTLVNRCGFIGKRAVKPRLAGGEIEFVLKIVGEVEGTGSNGIPGDPYEMGLHNDQAY